MLPLLTLLAMSAFVPVWEIAQVGRQLADTLAATRRVHAVHAEPVRIADGPGWRSRGRDATTRPRSRCTTSPSPIPAGDGPRSATCRSRCRRARPSRWSGRPGRARPRSRACCCASGIRTGRDHASPTRPARVRARGPAPPHRAGGAGHPPLQRHAGRQHPLARPEAARADAGRRDRARRARPPGGRRSPRPRHEGGRARAQLSGGQRQRVAIARAFLQDAPDPDPGRGHLPPRRGERAGGALGARALSRDRTTVVIAHRLSTVRAADQIVVLDEGRVVEQGRHEDPARRRGSTRTWSPASSPPPSPPDPGPRLSPGGSTRRPGRSSI